MAMLVQIQEYRPRQKNADSLNRVFIAAPIILAACIWFYARFNSLHRKSVQDQCIGRG